VRYGDTPQPATPYQSAAQVWDERIGSARVQARNWRFMAFGCLGLALLMAGGLAWRSAQSIVTPYVIEVDQAGQVRAVGEAATPYRPSDAQIAYHLGALHRSGALAVHRPHRGAAELARCLRLHDRQRRRGAQRLRPRQRPVRAYRQGVGDGADQQRVRASDTSFNVRWTETRFVNGAAGSHRTLERRGVHRAADPAHRAARCAKTPWASTPTGSSWSRELEANEGAKP
jgi:type IV secretory pathway TrbF-like protein